MGDPIKEILSQASIARQVIKTHKLSHHVKVVVHGKIDMFSLVFLFSRYIYAPI